MSGEPRYPFVHLDVPPDEVDEQSAWLFELGAEGVEERDESTLLKNATSGRVTLVAAFPTRDDADRAIAEIDASYMPRYEEIVGDAWRDAWKEHYKPYAIADGLVVRPPWEPYTPREGETVLELEPGRAFGTGLHETTRLVARAIKGRTASFEQGAVLDVGCGSGILALAAIALGANRAVAIDNDPEAIDVTRENAARNSMSARLEASTTDITNITETFPLVVANIEARVLIPMARDLESRVAPQGLLFLSGILASQCDEVRAAYTQIKWVTTEQLGEWVLLVFQKPA